MKKFIAGFIAIILAIGFSAFTFHNRHFVKAKAGEKWFKFNGVDPTDLNTQSKYSLDGDGSQPLVCANDIISAYRCEILAVPVGTPVRPILATIVDVRRRLTP